MWGKNCYLKNHCQDDAFVAPIMFKHQMKPNKIKEISLTVYIPANFDKEKIVLLFQFEDSNADRFGDPMIGIIDIELPE